MNFFTFIFKVGLSRRINQISGINSFKYPPVIQLLDNFGIIRFTIEPCFRKYQNKKVGDTEKTTAGTKVA